jgi:hypothetical protein
MEIILSCGFLSKIIQESKERKQPSKAGTAGKNWVFAEDGPPAPPVSQRFPLTISPFDIILGPWNIVIRY